MSLCGWKPRMAIMTMMPLLLLLHTWPPTSATVTEKAASAADVVSIRTSPIADKPVVDWSVADVEYWMQYVVGYAEYGRYVRKHLIDGPTLLEMQPFDFEEHLPIENALHVIKLSAHLKLVKGMCLCASPEVSVSDFWSYMRQHSFRVWVVGSTSVFFPRLGMLYTILFDDELYRMLIGVAVQQSTALEEAAANKSSTLESAIAATRRVPLLHTILFIFSMLVAPDLFMAFQAMRMVTTNYFIMPIFILYFIFQAYNDYLFFYLAYVGAAFPPGLHPLKKIWMLFSYTLFIPPVTILLYPLLPHFLLVFLVGLLLLNCIFTIFAFITMEISRRTGAGAGDQSHDGRKHE